MLKPNDLPIFVEQQKPVSIKIDDLVKEAKKSLKKALLEARLEAFGRKIELITTKTRFGGERFWFVCPSCAKRVGKLYALPENMKAVCRICFRMHYGKK